MGARAMHHINGPWTVDVNFPGRLSRTITPESFEEITQSVEVLTPPTPVFGARFGLGMPVGLLVKGARLLRSIELPVFEWVGIEGSGSFTSGGCSSRSVVVTEDQRYFALEKRFEGTACKTPRVTIGRVALLDEVVACSMQVQPSGCSMPQVREAVVKSQQTVEESVARAVFHIINGESEHPISYDEARNKYIYEEIQLTLRAHMLLAGEPPDSYDI